MDKIDLGSQFLHCHIANHVMTVRIDRVDRRNSMTQAMYRGVKRAAILADNNSQVDILLLTGSEDVFAVGGDMSGAADGEHLDQELDPTDNFPFRHLERCSKAVIAAVNGLCYAGGLNLLLYSDLSIVSDRAKFRAPELIRGIPDAWIGTRLASYVGAGMAKYWLYTAEVFDAEQARQAGLIGKVVAHEDFEKEVQATIQAVLRNGPKSRAIIKKDMNQHLSEPDPDIFKQAIHSEELKEGTSAFLEKRPAVWPRD